MDRSGDVFLGRDSTGCRYCISQNGVEWTLSIRDAEGKEEVWFGSSDSSRPHGAYMRWRGRIPTALRTVTLINTVTPLPELNRTKPEARKEEPTPSPVSAPPAAENHQSGEPARRGVSGWQAVAQTWQAATDIIPLAKAAKSFSKSLLSRGLDDKTVDQTTRALRVTSCHGDADIPPCPARDFSVENRYHYCNACRCGEREMARLSERGSDQNAPQFDPEGYDKLQYPYLECPRARLGFSNGVDLRDFFDAVYVISLRHRKDRLDAFWAGLAKCNWPFKKPVVVPAVNGNACAPDFFGNQWGRGTWGCLQSHARVFEDCLSIGHSRVLIMEDDATFVSDFNLKVDTFLREVPSNWQQLMIGGQFFGESTRVAVTKNVLRVTHVERTHCYAIKKDAMLSLYKYWQTNRRGHCDWMMGDWQTRNNPDTAGRSGIHVYAPTEFLAGQGACSSDINGRTEGTRFWTNRAQTANRVYWISCTRAVKDELVKRGFHFGYTIDKETGADAGMCSAHKAEDRGAKINEIRRVVSWVKSEAGHIDDGVAVLWHPQIGADLYAEACPEATYLKGETAEEIINSYNATTVQESKK